MINGHQLKQFASCTYITNFSSNNGNSVLFWTFVLYFSVMPNFSSGLKWKRTNGSHEPLLLIGTKFRALTTSNCVKKMNEISH